MWLARFALALMLLSGCSAATVLAKKVCQLDKDCTGAMQICVNGKCVRCTRDEHCLAVCFYCDQTTNQCEKRRGCCADTNGCVAGVCNLTKHDKWPTCEACPVNIRCRAGMICDYGRCIPGPQYQKKHPLKYPNCTRDEQCSKKRQACLKGRCRDCRPGATTCKGSPCHRCTKDFTCKRIPGCCMSYLDCEGKTTCYTQPGKPTGTCKPTCTSDRNCKKGYHCRLWQCLKNPKAR